MTPRTKKTAAAVSGALILASGAYALGSQAGDGSALAGTTPSSSTTNQAGPYGPGPGRRGDPGRDLTDLAGRLGVSEAKLRTALDDLRPDRNAKDDHHAALAKALGDALGLSAAKVTAALEKLHGPDKQHGSDRRGDPRDGFEAALATKLGVDPAKVRSAFDALRPPAGRRQGGPPDLAALAQKIGVSEAKLRSAIADLRPGGPGGPRPGGPGPGGPGGPRPGGRFGPGGPADDSALAKALGVTQAELRAAMTKIRGTLEQQEQTERDAFAAKLAAKLGISEAKVKEVIGSEPHHGRRGP
jgi:biotin operon repressor